MDFLSLRTKEAAAWKRKGEGGGGRKKAAQLNGIPLHNALGEAGRPVAAPSALALCVSPPGSDAFARGETLRQKEDGKKERRGIRWRAVFLRHAFKMSQRPCRWPRTEVVHRVSKAREKVSSGRELCSGSFTFEPAEKDKDKNLGSLQCWRPLSGVLPGKMSEQDGGLVGARPLPYVYSYVRTIPR